MLTVWGSVGGLGSGGKAITTLKTTNNTLAIIF
jgi:hypothetical protein